ncbi:YhdT family protein [Bacillus benzoevorans]|uniref:Putative membrane protein YhdT n=1 Tax=Bacillus benzoevorans TaxID=1456 RepID=A0A7X0LXI8_9BACI|nr:YhdT family protein [Bacillus benzoevorans]MBB6447823.1 putative membrane protein YhdT [Bacillus benzoevorans]
MVKQLFNAKDKRFKVAHKEVRIGAVLVIINFLLWFGFAYGMGSGDPREYNYILGLPEWFFYSCIFGTLMSTLLVILSVKFLFREVSFDGQDGSE